MPFISSCIILAISSEDAIQIILDVSLQVFLYTAIDLEDEYNIKVDITSTLKKLIETAEGIKINYH